MSRFTLPKLTIDYDSIEKLENNETTIILTNEILKEYELDIDKTKIDRFEDINFVSVMRGF